LQPVVNSSGLTVTRAVTDVADPAASVVGWRIPQWIREIEGPVFIEADVIRRVQREALDTGYDRLNQTAG
jgi:hypothetical protein